jgi:hypothetical protein
VLDNQAVLSRNPWSELFPSAVCPAGGTYSIRTRNVCCLSRRFLCGSTKLMDFYAKYLQKSVLALSSRQVAILAYSASSTPPT